MGEDCHFAAAWYPPKFWLLGKRNVLNWWTKQGEEKALSLNFSFLYILKNSFKNQGSLGGGGCAASTLPPRLLPPLPAPFSILSYLFLFNTVGVRFCVRNPLQRQGLFHDFWVNLDDKETDFYQDHRKSIANLKKIDNTQMGFFSLRLIKMWNDTSIRSVDNRAIQYVTIFILTSARIWWVKFKREKKEAWMQIEK